MLNWFYKLKSDHRGAVTVFIVLILIPSIAFTGFFVDFARVKLYKQQAISTADTYANSVLSYYDGILQDIYGLYGISQNGLSDEIDNALKSYAKTAFNPNEYHAEQTNVEKLVDKFTNGSSVTGFMPYANADVSFEYSKVSDMNLGNPTVLTNQIADYSKYIVPIELFKSAISNIGDNDNDSNNTSNNNNNNDDGNNDNLLDAIDDKSTSSDSALLEKKNELDKQLKLLSSRCQDYYKDLVEINRYPATANETKIFRDSILDIINATDDNLIDYINSQNKEYTKLQNQIIEVQNEIATKTEESSQVTQKIDAISDGTKNIYQKNLDIKKYNKIATENSTFEYILPDNIDSMEYQDKNKEYEKYNNKVDEYNQSNSDKPYKIEYVVNPSEQSNYNSLEELYNKQDTLIGEITTLQTQITPITTNMDSIKTDINNKIQNSNIENKIMGFESEKYSLNEYKQHLEKLNTICNELDGLNLSICFLQGQVQKLYNECKNLMNDDNLSDSVKNQVESDLSQIEPLITYKFDKLTKTIVDTNTKIIENDTKAIDKYLDNNGKGFEYLLEYCNNPIYSNVVEYDDDGNPTKYEAYQLDKSNYDQKIDYTFGQGYINIEKNQNNFDKIKLINVDESGNKTSEEIGIFEYLKRSYSTTNTPTDSNTPTSEDSAKGKADGQQDKIANDLTLKLSADSFREKFFRWIPDSYWSEFSKDDQKDDISKSPDMNLGKQFNFDYIKGKSTYLLDKFLLEEYDYRMFSNYTTKPNEDEPVLSLAYVPINTQVNYLMNSELEYIYAGKQSAAENISAVCLRIFAVRFALDFISTYKIREINTLINIVKSAVSAVATPVVGVIVAGIVRVVVAMVMAASDLTRLLSDEDNDVVLFQRKFSDLSAADSLKDIFGSYTSKDFSGDTNEKRGFSLKYTDYLRLMIMIFRDENTIATRTGNLIELNINNYITDSNANETDALNEHSFKMSEVQTMIDAKVTIKTDFLFTNFFLTDDFIPNQDTKNSVDSFTKQGYSYTLKKGY